MNEALFLDLAIIHSDAFLELPLSAQALYFHFALHADAEGTVTCPRAIMRAVYASDFDFEALKDGFIWVCDDRPGISLNCPIDGDCEGI